MKNFFSALILVFLFVPSSLVFGQCAEGESEVVVQILTDNYPAETTWTLSDASGALLSGGPYQGTNTTYKTLEKQVCQPTNAKSAVGLLVLAADASLRYP